MALEVATGDQLAGLMASRLRKVIELSRRTGESLSIEIVEPRIFRQPGPTHEHCGYRVQFRDRIKALVPDWADSELDRVIPNFGWNDGTTMEIGELLLMRGREDQILKPNVPRGFVGPIFGPRDGLLARLESKNRTVREILDCLIKVPRGVWVSWPGAWNRNRTDRFWFAAPYDRSSLLSQYIMQIEHLMSKQLSR
jgi:hypothetical protein